VDENNTVHGQQGDHSTRTMPSDLVAPEQVYMMRMLYFQSCMPVSWFVCQSLRLSACPPACLSVCLSVSQSVSLSVSSCLCLPVHLLSVCQSVFLSVCPSVCQVGFRGLGFRVPSVCLPICLSVRLPGWLVGWLSRFVVSI
jgi:hypothetical protein